MSGNVQSFVSRFFSAPWLFKEEIGDTHYEMLKSDEGSDEGNEAEKDLSAVVTIDDILDEIGLTSFHIKLILLLGCLSLLVSFEITMFAVISPVVKLEWNLSIWEEAMIPLVATCGMAVGSLILGWICDQYGRKRAHVAASMWIFCVGLTSYLAISYYLLLVFLFLVGLGLAIITHVITNIEEFSPKVYRTKLSLLSNIFWTLGFLISAIASAFINYLGFRGALALVCIPAAVFIMGTPLIPESPRFCLTSGDNEKALLILQQIASKKMSIKFQSWKLYKNVDTPLTRGSVVELFRHGYGKITCCLSVVSLFIELSNYFIVISVPELAANKVSLARNQTELNNNYYSTLAWMSLPEVLLILFATTASHFFNSKTLLLVFTSVAVLLQASLLFVGFNHKITTLILVVLSRGCMSCETAMLVVYTCEIYPTTIRGIGLGVGFSIGRVGMIAGPLIAQTLFQKTYFLGTLANIVSLVLALVGIICLPFRSENQMLE